MSIQIFIPLTVSKLNEVNETYLQYLDPTWRDFTANTIYSTVIKIIYETDKPSWKVE